MFDRLRADFAHYCVIDAGDPLPGFLKRLRVVADAPSLQAIAVFRFGSYLHERRLSLPRIVSKPLGLLHFVLDKITVIMWGITIDARAEIAGGLYLGHQGGIVIGPIVMGRDCCVAHNVTIGVRTDGVGSGRPKIGDRVWIGTGAVVFGGIRIGEGVTIGPLTLVGRNLPSRTLAIGNPVQILSRGYDNSAQIFGKSRQAVENQK
ncbi:MAG TPA: serine acetyltransferase [Vicinamibacterales bacterium]|jgi:serine O-acetyltransferase